MYEFWIFCDNNKCVQTVYAQVCDSFDRFGMPALNNTIMNVVRKIVERDIMTLQIFVCTTNILSKICANTTFNLLITNLNKFFTR